MAESEKITWLNSDQAAERLGITTRTLQQLIKNKQITVYRMGRRYRFDEKDVITYLKRCRQASEE